MEEKRCTAKNREETSNIGVMSWFYNWQFAKVFRENHESCRIGNGAAGFHLIIKEVFRYEDDISAKEEIQS